MSCWAGVAVKYSRYPPHWDWDWDYGCRVSEFRSAASTWISSAEAGVTEEERVVVINDSTERNKSKSDCHKIDQAMFCRSPQFRPVLQGSSRVMG